MIWDKPRDVAWASILAPGDLRERQASPHVQALAETYKATGGRPGNRLWVIKRRLGWELIAGGDRFAAAGLVGKPPMPVDVILEATREELDDLRDIENLYRRPVEDRDAKIAAHVAKRAARIEADRASGTAVPPSKPKPAKAQARAELAAAMGTTPAAVKQAEKRAAAKERDEGRSNHTRPGGSGVQDHGAGPDGPATGSRVGAPSPIDLHGHPMPAGLDTNLAPILPKLKKLDDLLRQAQAVTTDLEATTFPRGITATFKGLLHDVAARVRFEAPTDLCPRCSGESMRSAAARCVLCQEQGWVSRSKYESAPKNSSPPRPKAKPQKEMTVNGRPLSELQAEVGAEPTGELTVEREEEVNW